MSNVLCPAPWNALYYKDSLKSYKPCCDFKKWIKADSIEEYYNSDLLNEVKENLSQGKWHNGCKVCEVKSNNNIRSMANVLMDTLIKDQVDTTKFELKWLDYRPGNLCNLKCRMCSVVNSNMIEKEALENPIIMEVLPELDKKLFEIDHTNNELLPDLIDPEIFKGLKILKVLGGEPTLDPQIFKLLEYVGNLDSAKNIKLMYTTNATSVNSRWFNSTKMFKEVSINFSIDASYETYDYIRTGASYAKVLENIRTIIDKTENFSDAKINIVWSNFNALTVDQWANDLIDFANSFDNKINFTVIDARYPDFLHTRFLPTTIKQEVINKIENVKDENLARIFKQYTSSVASVEEILHIKKMFFNYADALDSVRNTDINNISTLYKDWRAYVE